MIPLSPIPLPSTLAATDEFEQKDTKITKDAYVDIQNYHGMTPLMWAAMSPSPKVADALLEAGADPRIIDKDSEQHPIYVADGGVDRVS